MAIAEALVAKKSTDDGGKTQAAQIPLEILRMARAIVGIRGGSVSKLIADAARPGLRKIIKEMNERGELPSLLDESD